MKSVVLFCLAACATSSTENGQMLNGGCTRSAECPAGFYCDQNLFACAVSGGYGDPTKVACGLNADCAAREEVCDLDSHTCQAAADSQGLSTQSAPPTTECTACQTDDDCESVFETTGCWLQNSAGDFAFCGVDCTGGGTCPAGSTCVLDHGGSASLCMPAASCDGGGSSGGTSGGSSGSSSGGSCTGATDTWANFAGDFFTNNCVGCHSDFAAYSGVQSASAQIKSKLSANKMPPPPATLTAADRQRAITWITCGLPQ